MEQDKIAKWQRRIEETFELESGKAKMSLQKLELIEIRLSQELSERMSGHLCIMDALLAFYIETFEHVAARRDSKWPEMTHVLTVVHIANFWRLRASYLLYKNGYFVDAGSLLRAVFENVLQIAAVKLDIITIDEVFGKLKTEDAKNLTKEEIERLIRKYTFESDSKVKALLVGEDSGLSADTIEDFKTFTRLLHTAVHKAKLNIMWYYGPWVRGESSLPIFPIYNEDLAVFYMNYSWFIGWMALRTFPLLQMDDGEFPLSWREKYQVLDESFQESVYDFPKRMGKSVQELVTTKFSFWP